MIKMKKEEVEKKEVLKKLGYEDYEDGFLVYRNNKGVRKITDTIKVIELKKLWEKSK